LIAFAKSLVETTRLTAVAEKLPLELGELLNTARTHEIIKS
jgi:hypothetical protein